VNCTQLFGCFVRSYELHSFYRAMLRRVLIRQVVCLSVCLSVRPSVCLPVTLRYRDHIRWNSSKIISPLVSLECSLSADPNITDLILIQGEHPQHFGRSRGGEKSGFRRTEALISLKCGKIALRLLSKTNRKSYTRFPVVPKSTTLDDLEGSLCTLFQNTCAMAFLFIYFSHSVCF